MSSYNKITAIGNLGKDPETTTLNSGKKVVKFRIASSETWRDKTTGERREKTEWIPVVIYNENIGKVAEKYLRKGSKCLVEGKFSTREWEDRDGAKRQITECVLEDFRGTLVLLGDNNGGDRGRGRDDDDRDDRRSSSRSSSSSRRDDGRGRDGGGSRKQSSYQNDLDDDIPF